MGIIAWIVVGLLAGILAKAVMPGSSNEPGGYIGTILLGIVGAVVAGFLGAGGGFSVMGILWATIGACIVIGVARLFTRGSSAI